MRDRMELTGYLIVGLEDKLEPIQALRELIENSEKEKATCIDIEITPDYFSFTDNGIGCDDLNLLVTPSQSRSRYDLEGTGSKGVGAKEAMATFGRTWEIHSVTRAGQDVGQYRHHQIAWDLNGPLPFKFAGEGKPANIAPALIRGGGTKLIVKDRKEGFPRLTMRRMEDWCRNLERTYRPALHAGKLIINIANSEIGFNYRLRNTAFDKQKFTKWPLDEFELQLEGKRIKVRYGVLHKVDDVLSGVHYVFGPRVMTTMQGINSVSVPLTCFVDVTLAPEWKLLLSTNKERVRYRDEIDDLLLAHLKSWIEQQEKEVVSYKLQIELGKAEAPINTILSMLNTTKTGNWQAKPIKRKNQQKKKSEKKEAREVIVEPHEHTTRRRQAIPGYDFGVSKIDKASHCMKIEIKPSDLGFRLYNPQIINGVAIINININPTHHPEMFEQIMREGWKVTSLAAWAYADAASLKPSEFTRVFDALAQQGYPIDESTPAHEIRNMVGNFLVAELNKQVTSKRKVA
jgi:Histidine kinase-, DNA gyrase B-, and HSP90-like ATPase